jgi:hypothetical protein
VLDQHKTEDLSFRDYYKDGRCGISSPGREGYWGALEFRRVDVNCMYPSGSSEHESYHSLGLYVRGSPAGDFVRKAIISEDSRRDFGIWCPKDRLAWAALEKQIESRELLALLPPPSQASLVALEKTIKKARKDILRRFGHDPDLLYEHFEQRTIADWLAEAKTLTKPIAAASMRTVDAMPAAKFHGNAL